MLFKFRSIHWPSNTRLKSQFQKWPTSWTCNTELEEGYFVGNAATSNKISGYFFISAVRKFWECPPLLPLNPIIGENRHMVWFLFSNTVYNMIAKFGYFVVELPTYSCASVIRVHFWLIFTLLFLFLQEGILIYSITVPFLFSSFFLLFLFFSFFFSLQERITHRTYLFVGFGFSHDKNTEYLRWLHSIPAAWVS